MRCAALTILLFASPAHASESEEIPIEALPPALIEHVNSSFKGAELRRAWRESESDQSCYVVSIFYRGRTHSYYFSRNGDSFAAKDEMPSLLDLPEYVLRLGVILLLGCPAGAFSRWCARTSTENKLSLRREWVSTWGGATAFLIIVLFAAPDGVGRRGKDVLVVVLEGVVWGGLAASVVEVVANTRGGNRRVILGFGLASLTFIVLAVLVQMLHIERDNQHFRNMMLRRSAYSASAAT